MIIQPSIAIKQMLETYGYPFKSKEHSHKIMVYKSKGETDYIKRYKDGINKDGSRTQFSCPKKLLYQFDEKFNLKISNRCCDFLKKKPANEWSKKAKKEITITGMRKEEGGERTKLNCIVTDKDGKAVKFHPLSKVDDDWEEWFIKEHNIELCKLYYPPFNFNRTGCKGCPFALGLQEQLDIMEELLPNEYKQCEIIWKPVYDEYRRIGYRLKREKQITIFDFIDE